MVKKHRLIFYISFLSTLIFYPFLAINAADPLDSLQWYLQRIKAPQAWDISKGEEQVIVAVLDTGVDLDHPDLQGNIWFNAAEIPNDGLDNDLNGLVDDYYGWNFVDNQNCGAPYLADGFDAQAVEHGTFVAGVISAIHDNNFAGKGVTAKVKIMPLVVLDSYGFGDSGAVVKAFDYAIKNGADVINLSFGGYDYSQDLKEKIIEANQKNITIVAAAGNSLLGGIDLDVSPMYPICYDYEWQANKIIGVASTDKNDVLSSFSNYGSCIDISAPGEELSGLVLNEPEYQLKNFSVDDYKGTSFATAMVSGSVALIKSINQYLNNEQILQILQSTADDISDKNITQQNDFGSGMLNIYQALNAVVEKYSSQAKMQIAISADQEKNSQVRYFNNDLNFIKEANVFDSDFQGLNLGSADIDNDGQTEILVGAAAGEMPFVRAIDKDEVLVTSFLAFEADWQGGVRVAAGDVNNDSQIEIVAAAQSQRLPVIRIFNWQGKLLNEFLAFDKDNQSGITVAVANVTGDSQEEIIVGAPFGNVPEVKIFNYQGQLLKTLMVFVPQFIGGVNVSAANIDNVGYDEIIVGAGAGGGPHVRVLNYDGQQLASFFAYNSNFRGGVRAAAADINGDNILEIITVPGYGGGPHLRIWDLAANLLNEVFVFEADYTGGVQVAIIESK